MPLDGGFPTECRCRWPRRARTRPTARSWPTCPLPRAFQAWKRYRGGQTSPIWIADLADSSVEKVPRENSNDFNPMWVGDSVYFLSDRDGPVTLFAYDTATKRSRRSFRTTASTSSRPRPGPDAIVYEQFGSLHLFDLKSSKASKVDVTISGDLPAVRPRFEKVGKRIANAAISPTGARAVFEARGEILTVPAEKGDVRNLTNTPGVAERDPAWSPDGKWIAYFSDESGEYALHLRDQNGMGEVKKINLGNPPSFFYAPIWSPDSKKIAYTDKRLNLWYVDLDKGDAGQGRHESPTTARASARAGRPTAAGSPTRKQLEVLVQRGLRLLAGRRQEPPGHRRDERRRSRRRSTRAASTSTSPPAPTSARPSSASTCRAIRTARRAASTSVVLRKDVPSPLAPESDEEKDADEKHGEKTAEKPTRAARRKRPTRRPEQARDKKEPPTVKIDFDDIDQRILALPIPARNYVGLAAGQGGHRSSSSKSPTRRRARPGAIAAQVRPGEAQAREGARRRQRLRPVGQRREDALPAGRELVHRRDRRSRSSPARASSRPTRWRSASTRAPSGSRCTARSGASSATSSTTRTSTASTCKAAAKKYEPYLEALAQPRRPELPVRGDARRAVGRPPLRRRAATCPSPKRVQGGLLGADYEVENGRYRFAQVYNGENWNPELRAPLTQPGVNVKEGEYLLAVNGRDLRASDNVYRFFEGTAGKQVVIRVGPNPDGTDAREVTVVPVDERERPAATCAWVEDNRRKVDQMTRRQAGLRLPAGHGAGRLHQLQPLLLRPGRQGGRGHRRALQRRRPRGRLHHRLPAQAAR